MYIAAPDRRVTSWGHTNKIKRRFFAHLHCFPCTIVPSKWVRSKLELFFGKADTSHSSEGAFISPKFCSFGLDHVLKINSPDWLRSCHLGQKEPAFGDTAWNNFILCRLSRHLTHSDLFTLSKAHILSCVGGSALQNVAPDLEEKRRENCHPSLRARRFVEMTSSITC